MNINKLQYFITVYEEGSITAAAKKHFISQVAMSQQIISLEEELGVNLFLREKKRLHQTFAAHYFYEEIKKILKSYDNLVIDIKNYAGDNKRILRIGVNYYSLYEWLKQYTRQFEEFFQDTAILFEFFPSNELISQLDKGFLDIILVWDEYTDNLGFSTLGAFVSRNAVLIPCGNPLSESDTFSFSLLQGQRVVVLIEELPYFRRTGHLEKLFHDIYRDTPLTKGDIIITDNINQALLLASEEHLIIITYEDKLYKIAQSNLKKYIIENSFMESRFVLAWKGTESNTAIKPFTSFMEQKLMSCPDRFHTDS